jgi:hypothetical protein
VIDKKSEKILKYKDLTIEMKRTLGLTTKLIPVITGATRTTSKSFTKYLSNIPESRISRKYRKHPYCALRSYFKKY